MTSHLDKMRDLGLHGNWINYGYVDEVFIEELHKIYLQDLTGADEHYRIPVYSRFFKKIGINKIAMQDFHQYLELVAVELDECLRSWALSWLVEHPELTVAQFSILSNHPLVLQSPKHLYFLKRNR